MTKGIELVLVMLTSCSYGFGFSTTNYDGFKVFRVSLPDRSTADRLHEVVNDCAEYWSELPGRHADLMVAPKNLQEFVKIMRDEDFTFYTMIENISDLIFNEQLKARSTRSLESSVDHTMEWTKYHSSADIDFYLKYLARTYPDLVSLELIGKSFLGQDMNVIKICQGGCGTKNKPAMWIDGGIHAREWITSAVATFIIHQLVEVQDPTESDLLENVDWYILPLLNPDGYEYTRSNDRLWRKTMSVNNGTSCLGCDANRNWDFQYGGLGASEAPCSDAYQGPFAFSEVETQNVRNFILAQNGSIKFFNSLHSYSQLILLPWGYTRKRPQNYNKLKRFAEKSNEALYATHQQNYFVSNIASGIYFASGTAVDWAFGVAKIPYTISMELRDGGEFGFLLPTDQIIPTGEEVWAFHKASAKQIIDEFTLGLRDDYEEEEEFEFLIPENQIDSDVEDFEYSKASSSRQRIKVFSRQIVNILISLCQIYFNT